VIYVGAFNKAIFPGLRLGYLVAHLGGGLQDVAAEAAAARAGVVARAVSRSIGARRRARR
jgi:DNA-binding transcriptional MocR family regulator